MTIKTQRVCDGCGVDIHKEMSFRKIHVGRLSNVETVYAPERNAGSDVCAKCCDGANGVRLSDLIRRIDVT